MNNTTPNIENNINFLLEIEKLKQVYRQTKLIGEDRHENSAEHSWQIAVFALSLAPYAEQAVDINRVVTMLLLHDIVEIDTGDVIAYSDAHHNPEEEEKAAQRIFGLLDEPKCSQLINLWVEFESKQTPDSQFAHAIDRCTPVLLNLNNEGQSWRAHKITKQQVIAKNGPAAQKACPTLWQYIESKLDQAEQQGWFDY